MDQGSNECEVGGAQERPACTYWLAERLARLTGVMFKVRVTWMAPVAANLPAGAWNEPVGPQGESSEVRVAWSAVKKDPAQTVSLGGLVRAKWGLGEPDLRMGRIWFSWPG